MDQHIPATAHDADTPVACLLIHGYGGSPFEMEGIAAALTDAGLTARTVCLPGHGDDSAQFHAYRFADWLAHAEQAFTELAANGSRVVLIGFSMGGTIALHMAARLPVAGVVAISAPAYMLNLFPWPLTQGAFYAHFLAVQVRRLLARYVSPSSLGETSRDIAPWKGYDGPISVPQLLSFRAGCGEMRRLLPRLTVPLLLMHDATDMLVPCRNAWAIAEGAASTKLTLIVTRVQEMATRHHVIVTHRETAALVAENVTRFARSV